MTLPYRGGMMLADLLSRLMGGHVVRISDPSYLARVLVPCMDGRHLAYTLRHAPDGAWYVRLQGTPVTPVTRNGV